MTSGVIPLPNRAPGGELLPRLIADAIADALADGRLTVIIGTLGDLTAGDSPMPVQLRVAAASATAILEREGEIWTFTCEGRRVRVLDGRGVRYLAALLENPDVEISALDLVSLADGGTPAGRARQSGPGGELEVRAAGDDGIGPLIDARAASAYKARMKELQSELEEAETFNDPERAARAREELDFLAAEISRAFGLGGRARPTTSSAERARVNVTRAVRCLLKRIREHDEQLGRELERSIRTGTFCSYAADDRAPLEWRVTRD